MHIRKNILNIMILMVGGILFAVPTLAATPASGVLTDISKVHVSAGYTKVIKKLAKNVKV
jgi:hypothetical protein